MRPIAAGVATAVALAFALTLVSRSDLVARQFADMRSTWMAPARSVPANAVDAPGDRPATVVKPLSCEKLSDLPGKAVTTALVTFPPLAYSPAHRHPGSVTAFVVRGTVRSQMAGGASIDYAPGKTWFEPAGALHLFAENPSPTEPAELLAVFIADENCGPLVIPEGS